jgi:PAS domain-containing protein
MSNLSSFMPMVDASPTLSGDRTGLDTPAPVLAAPSSLLESSLFEPALFEPNTWPEGLRAIADLIQASRFPMFLAIGRELRLFYNDAYSDLLGDKHPAARGAPYASVRPELWDRMRPYFDEVLAGESAQLQHALMEFERNGKRERRFFCVSLSPVRHAGQVAGVY